MSNYIKSFRAARRASVPIIVIRTPDYESVIKSILAEGLEFTNKEKAKVPVPILQWDSSRGVRGRNQRGGEVAEAVNLVEDANPQPDPSLTSANPVEALQRALASMEEGSILFMMNLHIGLESYDDDRMQLIQAVANCREEFKSTKRTLVLLVPGMKLPPELANDVITLDAPLPGREELLEIVKAQFGAAGLSLPADDVLDSAVSAVSGLSAFTAEQVTAMGMTPEGLNIMDMWERKIGIIEQVAGLKVKRNRTSFNELGGLMAIKQYLRKVINGKRRPRIVVLLDELEKQMAGVGGDNTGVSQDSLGVVLSSMENNRWSGVLAPGFPGTGKTETANAMGSEAEGLFIELDLGATKSSLVGSSEQRIRAAMAVLLAMGGDRVFFFGTTNDISAIPDALQQRFTHGTFFYDLPDTKTHGPIWDIWMAKCNLPKQDLPTTDGWVGRNIKACCLLADELGITLMEAKQYVVPVGRSMGTRGDKLREDANGRYLSAETEGFYIKKLPVGKTSAAIQKQVRTN